MQNFIAIVCSIFLCGTGHVIKGHRKRGLVFLGTFSFFMLATILCAVAFKAPLYKVGTVGFGVITLWIWLYCLIDISTLKITNLPVLITQKAEARYGQAMALYIQGQRSDARVIFEQLINENKKDVDSYFQIGKIACEENNFKLARKHFDKCKSLPGGEKWADEIQNAIEDMSDDTNSQPSGGAAHAL